MSGDGLVRMLYNDDDPPPDVRAELDSVALGVALDYLMTERWAIIQKLHKIDDILVEHGRLKKRTVPRRER